MKKNVYLFISRLSSLPLYSKLEKNEIDAPSPLYSPCLYRKSDIFQNIYNCDKIM